VELSGGQFLPPVQTLVATSIFCPKAENANRVRSPAPKILNAKAFGIFTFYLFTLHFSLKTHSGFLEVISNSEKLWYPLRG